MIEIPNEFHPYVTNIEDVEVDGSCGFQAITVFLGLGYAQSEYWLIMSDIRFLIANKYGVIVYFLDHKHDPSTCFLLWHSPQNISHHRSIVIAFVYNGHYVKVDLQESHQLLTVLGVTTYQNVLLDGKYCMMVDLMHIFH
uniref:OTU domain-containing protein n=1 Tax=Lactuca sativa TaxID=4236 RepID=A0A9R1VFM5_LACSA|nr:hypothetical protein LSAT_V11C500259490 [Lactuca sativa]